MLDYLRNITKSEKEKRQETLNAYLDDALAQDQVQRVESDLAQDEGLRAELDQMRLLQQRMRQLPQRRIRRNFTLDPALYGRPRREPLVLAYPVLRTATVLAAFFFIFALAANLYLNSTSGIYNAEPVAMYAESREEIIAEAVVEEAAEAEMMSVEPIGETDGEAIIDGRGVVEPRIETPEAGTTADAAMAISESILEAEEEAVTEEEALIVEEAVTVDEIGVESDLEAHIDEAAPALEPPEMESESGMAMEGAAPAEEPKAVGPEEDATLTILPSVAARASAVAEMAVEQQASPTIEVSEPARQPEPRATKVTVVEEDDIAGTGEIQAPREEGSFLVDSLGLIVLLFGIGFVILIVLTLMARRRL